MKTLRENRPNKVNKWTSNCCLRISTGSMCFFVALSTENTEAYFLKVKHPLSCKCYFVQHPGPKSIISVWVQRRRPASPHRPHSHYLHIALIFHPLRSKQLQTVQLLINTHNLQNLHVSQEPNCLLLYGRQSLRAHLYTCVRWQLP